MPNVNNDDEETLQPVEIRRWGTGNFLSDYAR